VISSILHGPFGQLLPFTAADPTEWVCYIARQSTPPAARTNDIPERVSATQVFRGGNGCDRYKAVEAGFGKSAA
jgi:hypothetical protein